jgi:hypothetical protein
MRLRNSLNYFRNIFEHDHNAEQSLSLRPARRGADARRPSGGRSHSEGIRLGMSTDPRAGLGRHLLCAAGDIVTRGLG